MLFRSVPTVGFGMGDVTLENFLKDNELIPDLNSETELYIMLAPGINYSDITKQLGILRDEGVKVAVDFSGKKLAKQIDNAVKKGVKYGIVIGDNEIKDNQYTLKDIKNNTESSHSLERIISIVKAK